MPHLSADDGTKLYYEEVGAGIPIVFIHEFAGDHRSWELRCGISATVTAALRTTRAAIRRPTCPTT